MKKIMLIIQREYLTRVKKKSFIIMTLLAPVLMAALVVVPVLLMTMGDTSAKKIAVIDKSKRFKNVLKDMKATQFQFIENGEVEHLKTAFKSSNYYAVLEIDSSVSSNPSNSVRMYSEKQPSMDIKMYVTNLIAKDIEREKLQAKGIDEEFIKNLKPDVEIKTIQWSEDGGEKVSSTEIAMVIGYIGAFMIYIFVFVYGSQVMRGVIEEKTSRVVEVIISSVKPFQLMMGKVVGVAGVALTQFLLWIILSGIMIVAAQSLLMPKDIESIKKQQVEQAMQSMGKTNVAATTNNDTFSTIMVFLGNMNWVLITCTFIFYFLAGYLLYASLFAAIGSAVDNEADTQQFMLPITIPLILAFVMAQTILQNPEGQIAFWFSIIPFTSPIVMLVRIPFGVPAWQLALSMFLLASTFVATIWVAAKIYRTGILMYGKKINYAELWKWLRYSN